MITERVSVLMVTHQSAGTLGRALEAVGALDHGNLELVVVDCGSTDDSVATARRAWPSGMEGELLELEENRGFTGGMNTGLAATEGPWILALNPDAYPRPDFLSRLLDTARGHPEVGAVTGRLLRSRREGEEELLDACGMYLVPTWRHLDRGSGRRDRGQLRRRCRVFGATGAATLYRRRALEDVALAGEIFDERFHSYREDAELSFRLRERGWEIVYEPGAVARHDRFNLPGRRSRMPPRVNFHSLKNRYLLRIYHQTVANLLWTLPFTLFRDLLAFGWVLLRERSSLGAYGWVWRHRKELFARRRRIQRRRRVSGGAIDRWFFVSELAWTGGGADR
ncbi:MAG: glycosyltransferase [Thermoanaerobaculia bacterium]|nr:glycosyltransferase [Thermoanaerobaculia bacterium]